MRTIAICDYLDELTEDVLQRGWLHLLFI